MPYVRLNALLLEVVPIVASVPDGRINVSLEVGRPDWKLVVLEPHRRVNVLLSGDESIVALALDV